jgi:hypothetical protein
MTTRRLPAPWRSEKMPGGYIVRDANGQALAYVYCRANEAEAMLAKVLTEDEARRIATNIAKLGVPFPKIHQKQPEAGGVLPDATVIGGQFYTDFLGA